MTPQPPGAHPHSTVAPLTVADPPQGQDDTGTYKGALSGQNPELDLRPDASQHARVPVCVSRAHRRLTGHIPWPKPSSRPRSDRTTVTSDNFHHCGHKTHIHCSKHRPHVRREDLRRGAWGSEGNPSHTVHGGRGHNPTQVCLMPPLVVLLGVATRRPWPSLVRQPRSLCAAVVYGA